MVDANGHGWHKRIRRDFSKIKEKTQMPPLVRVQKDSYDHFLQQGVSPEKRKNQGLQGVFQFFFPIRDHADRALLEFSHYTLEEPSYDVEEARQKGVTYASPLRVTFQLTLFDPEDATKVVRVEKQDVYMGEVPRITDNGTFIINGNERILISQVHRSPGISFDSDRGRNHASGKVLFLARIIPVRGAWIDFEFDSKDLLYVHIDQKRKILASSLLMALESKADEAKRATSNKKVPASEIKGITPQEILELFHGFLICDIREEGWSVPSFFQNAARGAILDWDLIPEEQGVSQEPLAKMGERLNARLLKKLQEKPEQRFLMQDSFFEGRILGKRVVSEQTGEVLAELGSALTTDLIKTFRETGIQQITILEGGLSGTESMYMRNTLMADKNTDRQSALFEIYRVLRPGDPPTLEGAHTFFDRLFFQEDRYDLSAVGRIRLNTRLGLSLPETLHTLTREDIVNILRFLIRIRDGHEKIDDTDSLSNRRVRSVGELVEAQYRLGFLRMQRSIRERFPLVELENASPSDIINTKPIASAVRELFATSQLSQFADQTNPLSEISHKLRLSSLGPGGLARTRASIEVRDVHPTQYGRICPIETPEGQNIGLINSLATYARINSYGFIETPYIRVIDGQPTDQIVYLTSAQEELVAIAQAGTLYKTHAPDTLIDCRKGGVHVLLTPRDIDYMDVSPKQIVSVAASMIPFVENNESGRALMGSNMQRQAVPLYRPHAPVVGTGMEAKVAEISGSIIRAKRPGIVEQVDSRSIVIRCEDGEEKSSLVDIYPLVKFRRTNGSTALHQRPIVSPGDRVQENDPLTEDFSTEAGEMALGQNVLVAFMPWRGYGFEDSIIVSERLVRDDVYTSIHIEEFEVIARDTKLGIEEITRDIPGINEEHLRHLDETGTPRIGAEVKAGDILVGKVTPKGDNPMTPEEKLLRAIFVDKASDVKDTSLRVPSGVEGTVIDVKIFSRKGVAKDDRALFIERLEIEQALKEKSIENQILDRGFQKSLIDLLVDQTYQKGLKDGIVEGSVLTRHFLEEVPESRLSEIVIQDESISKKIRHLKNRYKETLKDLEKRFEKRIEKIQRGADLLPGVLKVAKVFLAIKRKIQPGDKMAGRHGNKGVVSKIVPVEDMPYLEDGTPIDIILNPLGIPSRMNVGQIMETHLGWASFGLGRQIRDYLETFFVQNPLNSPEDITPQTLAPLKEQLKTVHGLASQTEQSHHSALDQLDDAQTLELAIQIARKGVSMKTPVFDGAKVNEIDATLNQAWSPQNQSHGSNTAPRISSAAPISQEETASQSQDRKYTSGQIYLRDGRTGELFDRPITVGVLYVLKLHHLVDDKIHARSVGPYSLVTQQPVGGRGMLGGQRLGEMEVWTLEAYGAAHTLQEMLTVKSDDVIGRSGVYTSIVQGECDFNIGIPASFHVLIKKLRSLALDIECTQEASKPEDEFAHFTGSILLKGHLKPQMNNNADPEFRPGSRPTEEEIKQFSSTRIRIASPNKIRSWSWGEVKKSDTINYRTQKPDEDGPFCAKIFGPMKNYECSCGKYKRMKYRGVICEKCHVEVTLSRVRRERMGHIELATPIAHIWYTKALPVRIGILLDLSTKDLDKILSFEHYVIIDPGLTPLKKYQIITVPECEQAKDLYGEDAFQALVGGEALKAMLHNMDLEKELENLRQELSTTSSELRRKKMIRRFKMIEAFIRSGTKPEWMVLEVLPVMPPDLRPLVPLDGGRFATSDFNELYRRVINRNNRLKRLMMLRAPDIIIRNEKRMLQEIVDALLDNGRRARAIVGANSKRPLKSLSEDLKGKRGIFRQNLLGKRVDYSGRSVIVVGAELQLHQCGLPKKMALELFKPFVYARLEKYGLASTVKAAKRIVEQERPEIWDILEEVIKEHPILLNRAPTLHRLGIQAFEPVLVEGKAIQLHPLVCTAYNADFDGDQMAVHIPLSLESQLESRILMMSVNNILSPAHGRPIILPSKDIVLGLYYLTMVVEDALGTQMMFASPEEAQMAYENKAVSLHATVKCRVTSWNAEGQPYQHTVTTTVGRVILGQTLPKKANVSFEWVNTLITSKAVAELVTKVHQACGQKAVIEFADALLRIGFHYVTVSGISFGKDDLCIPEEKWGIVEKTRQAVREYRQQFLDGLITEGERYNKVTDAWTKCSEEVAQAMMRGMSKTQSGKQINSVYMMADSGARGSPAQMRQLAAMRGLIARHDGTIIEHPIISNFKEGLNALEYFNSTHGARKGLSDLALKTANAGHLTRRMVDVAQDCVVQEKDCQTKRSVSVGPLIRGGEVVTPLSERIKGRVLAEDVIDVVADQVVFPAGTFVTEEKALEIQNTNLINKVKIRSVLTCEAKRGVCAQCYGQDLATGLMVQLGTAVGVMGAQSIGEPGTQLTMRTFHSGGAAQRSAEDSFLQANVAGVIRFKNGHFLKDTKDRSVVISRHMELLILNKEGRELTSHQVPYGAYLMISEGDFVEKGARLAEWDPYTVPIITEVSGIVRYVDLHKELSLNEVIDEMTGMTKRMVSDWKHNNRGKDLKPRLILTQPSGEPITLLGGQEARYFLSVNAILAVGDGAQVHRGDILARLPKESVKTRDITGGLPRVGELFEARRPKDPAIICDIDGRVDMGKDYKTKRKIAIIPDDDSMNPVEYLIPKGRQVIVQEGDRVSRGDLLVDGDPSPHDILRILGLEALASFLIREIQDVFHLQGVRINDKHFEVIIRHMLKKVEVTDPGDSTFLVGDQVDKYEVDCLNRELARLGGRAIQSVPVLQGITRASVGTQSYISAASFQETTRVLTEAAVFAKRDELHGLKENVIAGGLIPAGSGFIQRQWARESLMAFQQEEQEKMRSFIS